MVRPWISIEYFLTLLFHGLNLSTCKLTKRCNQLLGCSGWDILKANLDLQ